MIFTFTELIKLIMTYNLDIKHIFQNHFLKLCNMHKLGLLELQIPKDFRPLQTNRKYLFKYESNVN